MASTEKLDGDEDPVTTTPPAALPTTQPDSDAEKGSATFVSELSGHNRQQPSEDTARTGDGLQLPQAPPTDTNSFALRASVAWWQHPTFLFRTAILLLVVVIGLAFALWYRTDHSPGVETVPSENLTECRGDSEAAALRVQVDQAAEKLGAAEKSLALCRDEVQSKTEALAQCEERSTRDSDCCAAFGPRGSAEGVSAQEASMIAEVFSSMDAGSQTKFLQVALMNRFVTETTYGQFLTLPVEKQAIAFANYVKLFAGTDQHAVFIVQDFLGVGPVLAEKILKLGGWRHR